MTRNELARKGTVQIVKQAMREVEQMEKPFITDYLNGVISALQAQLKATKK